jgi:diaminohydroxyphosphoribosylaminopyrimidine deaminase/5-amino-6-(5-phosphoribosylamino)uracil reductase
MITDQDKHYLRRAMRLAMNGRGHVEPNPMVGCVLVKNDQIIGEGWHQKHGEAHAEPTALNDCKAKGNDPAGATAYVTLEPCCHTNKKTPPCAPRLVEAKIARVVIGCLDPNPEVNGKGAAMLRDAGIEVDCLPGTKPSVPVATVPGGEGKSAGQVQDDRRPQVTTPSPQSSPLNPGERELSASHFQQLIAQFACSQISYRANYLTLKWAESINGFVAGKNGERVQISNELSSRLVHQLRARSGAIIVGINTVLQDDPLLTVRGVHARRLPARVVIDRELRIPLNCKLVHTANDPAAGQVFVLCSKSTFGNSARVAELEALGIEVDELYDDDLVTALETHPWNRLEVPHRHFLVEPGPTLARSLLPSADRLWVFRSPSRIDGGPSAPRAAAIPDHYIPVATLNLAGDILTEYLNTQSPAFFAPVPSADFVLAQEDVAQNAPLHST